MGTRIHRTTCGHRVPIAAWRIAQQFGPETLIFCCGAYRAMIPDVDPSQMVMEYDIEEAENPVGIPH